MGNQTLASMARAHGLKPATVRARLRLGWSLDMALNTPPRVREVLRDADGNVVTHAQLAAQFGLKVKTLRNRLENGWPLEDALHIPCRAHTKDYDAKYGLPIAQWLEESGVTTAQFRHRLEHGWEPERAAREPLGLAAVLVKYVGKAAAADVRAACAEHDVPLTACVARLRAGWPVEKACTVPVQRNKTRDGGGSKEG